MCLEEQAVFNREWNKYGIGQRGLEFMYGVVRNASFPGSPALTRLRITSAPEACMNNSL
jgi:hypothetical protein